MTNNPIETISSRTAFECAWYRVQVSEIVLPDGARGAYNVVDVPPCAFVVPVTADNEIILIHQFRYPIGTWVWEVPAGAIHENETMLESAQAELREEVGGTSDAWTYLGQFQTANGRSNEVAYLYLARNVVVSGETAHEAAEIMTVHPTPIDRAVEMVMNNEIEDAPSALAILLALPHLQ